MSNERTSRGAPSSGRATRDPILVVLALPAVTACSENEPKQRRLAEGWRLIQKRQYQAVYAPNGRLARVRADRDADGGVDRTGNAAPPPAPPADPETP